ncbi:hypothetical protein QQX98_001907 [Neonectria punicea]|uniref:Metallothionein n=1 Tax=Neonectria punicea TaxID=979145 RepID=A0ABR1HL08_9HYPO
MCKKAACSTCKKTSWWGCGAHVQTVLDSVPVEDRCACEPKVDIGGKAYPPMATSPN